MFAQRKSSLSNNTPKKTVSYYVDEVETVLTKGFNEGQECYLNAALVFQLQPGRKHQRRGLHGRVKGGRSEMSQGQNVGCFVRRVLLARSGKGRCENTLVGQSLLIDFFYPLKTQIVCRLLFTLTPLCHVDVYDNISYW